MMGLTTLADIASLDWSLMLDSTAGEGAGSGLGRVVQGLDDVAQCVKIILTTPKGSDPLRPTFGADLWQYVDAPISAVRAQIVREVTEAVTLWEPRIDVVRATTSLLQNDPVQPGAHLQIIVKWRIKLSSRNPGLGSTQTTAVSIVN